MSSENKSLFLTKTFWGGVIAMAPAIASAFGIEILPEDTENLNAAADAILSGVGFLLVVVGRLKASQPAKIRPKKSGKAGSDG